MKNYALYLCPKLIDFNKDKTLSEDMETILIRIPLMILFWGTLKKIRKFKGTEVIKEPKIGDKLLP